MGRVLPSVSKMGSASPALLWPNGIPQSHIGSDWFSTSSQGRGAWSQRWLDLKKRRDIFANAVSSPGSLPTTQAQDMWGTREARDTDYPMAEAGSWALPFLQVRPLLEAALGVTIGFSLLGIHNWVVPGPGGLLQVLAQVEGAAGHAVQKAEDLEAALNPGWEWAATGEGRAQQLSKRPGLCVRPGPHRAFLLLQGPETAQQAEVLGQLLEEPVPPEEVTVDRVQVQRRRQGAEGVQDQVQGLAGGHRPPRLQRGLLERPLKVGEQRQQPIEATGHSEGSTAFGGLQDPEERLKHQWDKNEQSPGADLERWAPPHPCQSVTCSFLLLQRDSELPEARFWTSGRSLLFLFSLVLGCPSVLCFKRLLLKPMSIYMVALLSWVLT